MTAPTFDGTQACAGMDPELFFPTRATGARQKIAEAKKVCAACPFTDPCREYATWAQGSAGRYLDGVWGGTTARDRLRIRAAAHQRQRQDVAA